MAIGNPNPKRPPMGVFVMAMALVIAAFLGAAAGLVWQSADWFSEDPEEEVVTREQAPR